MPFCTECGTKINASDKFCGKCGKNLKEQVSNSQNKNAKSEKKQTNYEGTLHNDMTLKSLNCPKCNACLDVENGLDIFFCKYCGTKVILSGMSDAAYRARSESQKYEHQNRSQEMRNKNERERWERNEISKEREFKRKEKLKARKNALEILLLLFGFGCIALFFIMDFYISGNHNDKLTTLGKTVNQIEDCIKNEEYDQALLFTNRLYLNDHYSSEESEEWDAKRIEYRQIIRAAQKKSNQYNFITMPFDSYSCSDYSKTEIEKLLLDAGFSSIDYTPIEGKAGLFKKKNIVDHITIDEVSTFSQRDSFIEDAPIMIFYYEK